jgi:hypothetical protein
MKGYTGRSEEHSLNAKGIRTKEIWADQWRKKRGTFAPGWAFKIDHLQNIWNEEEEDVNLSKLGKKIAKRLEQWKAENHHTLNKYTNGDMLKEYNADEYDELENITDNFKNLDKYMDDPTNKDEFDDYLASLYNWADDNRVWLGD